ncbi:MAG: insulinase family protein [Oscillospiraceae bacterium]|jgi:predicted Zn-dependent peptidase|nr:insulinase family protein [Oscillospiraceae bacterium]
MEKITLPNGVRLLFEEIPHVRSAAVGIWVGSGSRHEPAHLSGISHAIEHMVFKGTRTRSAAQIASEMDAIGGQVNAFTTKECTCFYVRALDTHLPQALDVLTDIFFEPSLSESDWETERGVILEEIDMYEDTPEDLVSERLFAAAYRGCPLGRPILGTPAALRRLRAERIRAYMRENYRPDRIVVSMSGRFSARDRDFLLARFSALAPLPSLATEAAAFAPAFTARHKDIEQNHLCLAFPALPYNHPARYAQQVLSGILGGGMSSRLFQTVREQRGLCYSIYSFSVGHEDTGLFCLYTALGRETERAALRLVADIVRQFADEGPTRAETERAREQVKANVLMGMESTSSRMNHMGRSELLLGTIPSSEEIMARYDAVTPEIVRDLAGQLFDFSRLCFSAVGRAVRTAQYRRVFSD